MHEDEKEKSMHEDDEEEMKEIRETFQNKDGHKEGQIWTIEEITSLADSLADMSANLNQLVNRFNLNN